MTTTTSPDVLRDCDARELTAQIGRMNVLAISGGRVQVRQTGITLPVRYGYRVDIDLLASDTYRVQRVFARGTREWVKKEWREVYSDEVGKIAYQASCYLDN